MLKCSFLGFFFKSDSEIFKEISLVFLYNLLCQSVYLALLDKLTTETIQFLFLVKLHIGPVTVAFFFPIVSAPIEPLDARGLYASTW